MKPRIVVSRILNPFVASACEEVFYTQALAPVLFLYKTFKALSLGRNQSPWKELDLAEIKSEKVALTRRKTGGTCLYQDQGSSCFSFMSPNTPQDFKDLNHSIILRALRSLEIDAEVSNRNSITVEGKTVSNDFYKQKHHHSHIRSLHHGIMHITTDINSGIKYIKEKKGLGENTNLTEFEPLVTYEDFTKAISKSFTKQYPDAETIFLEGIPPIALTLAKEFQNETWIYGENPIFSHHIEAKFTWGCLDMHFEVQEGLVSQCKIFSDSLHPDFISLIENSVLKEKYGKDMFRTIEEQASAEHKILAIELCEWLAKTF